jgi:hypothetical protein
MQLDSKTEAWIVGNRLPSVADPEGAIPVAKFRDFVRKLTADVVVELVTLSQANQGVSAEWIDLVLSVNEGMYDSGRSLTGSVTSDLSHRRASTHPTASKE